MAKQLRQYVLTYTRQADRSPANLPPGLRRIREGSHHWLILAPTKPQAWQLAGQLCEANGWIRHGVSVRTKDCTLRLDNDPENAQGALQRMRAHWMQWCPKHPRYCLGAMRTWADRQA